MRNKILTSELRRNETEKKKLIQQFTPSKISITVKKITPLSLSLLLQEKRRKDTNMRIKNGTNRNRPI